MQRRSSIVTLPPPRRLAVLTVLLALSFVVFWKRESVRFWLWHTPMDSERMVGTGCPELPPLRALVGGPVRLADLRGRVVLLHFWTFA